MVIYLLSIMPSTWQGNYPSIYTHCKTGMLPVPCSEIQKILNVSATFISQFKIKFIKDGVKEFKRKYQGSKAYLSRDVGKLSIT
jgi:hypothetical protein